MQQQSLGLIETQGLTAAVEAADAAVKSANVTLVGYELALGGGWCTVKVQGDVGAVNAAVSAAAASAEKVGKVVSVKVIARPSDSLECLIKNKLTVGCDLYKDPKHSKHQTEKIEKVAEPEPTPVIEENIPSEEAQLDSPTQPETDIISSEEQPEEELTEPEVPEVEELKVEKKDPQPQQKDRDKKGNKKRRN